MLHGGAVRPLRERGRPFGVVGAPAVGPDQALLDELLQCGDHLVHPLRRRVPDVQLVEVDVIGSQPLQRRPAG
jgi:hypothetical protein